MERKNKQRLVKMFEMKCEGKTYQEIADTLGVTKQYIHQSLTAVISPKKKSKSIFNTLNIFISENNLSYKEVLEKLGLNITLPTLTRKLKGNIKFKMYELKRIKEVVGEDAFSEIIEYYTEKEMAKQCLEER